MLTVAPAHAGMLRSMWVYSSSASISKKSSKVLMMLFLKTKDIKPLDLQIRCKKMKEENK